MNQVWIIVLVLAGLYLISRVRSRRMRSKGEIPGPSLRITGYQLNTFLHPRMGRGCLYDHGMKFGRGLRRKEGPELPHDDACLCEVVAFTFTSSEVFNGALREFARVGNTIEGLPNPAAQELIERMQQAETHGVPESEAAYLAAIDPEAFAAAQSEPLTALLRERYAYLTTEPAATAPAAEAVSATEIAPDNTNTQPASESEENADRP